MKNYKNEKRWTYQNYEIALRHEEGLSKTANIISILGDIEDEYGAKDTQSHYVAAALIDDKTISCARGLGQESAVHNLYRSLADMDARRALEEHIYGGVAI